MEWASDVYIFIMYLQITVFVIDDRLANDMEWDIYFFPRWGIFEESD